MFSVLHYSARYKSFCRVHAVCVCDNADYFHGHIDETLDELGLSNIDSEGRSAVHSRDIIDIIEGYKGRGYGLSTDEELGMFSFPQLCRSRRPHQLHELQC